MTYQQEHQKLVALAEIVRDHQLDYSIRDEANQKWLELWKGHHCPICCAPLEHGCRFGRAR